MVARANLDEFFRWNRLYEILVAMLYIGFRKILPLFFIVCSCIQENGNVLVPSQATGSLEKPGGKTTQPIPDRKSKKEENVEQMSLTHEWLYNNQAVYRDEISSIHQEDDPGSCSASEKWVLTFGPCLNRFLSNDFCIAAKAYNYRFCDNSLENDSMSFYDPNETSSSDDNSPPGKETSVPSKTNTDCLSIALSESASECVEVLRSQLTQVSEGGATKSKYQTAFPGVLLDVNDGERSMENSAFVLSPDDSNEVVLEAKHPTGNDGKSQGGINFQIQLVDSSEKGFEEVILRYAVYFPADFQLGPPGEQNAWGGKLPGLAGGPSLGETKRDVPTGGIQQIDAAVSDQNTEEKCEQKTRVLNEENNGTFPYDYCSYGFSARHMWMHLSTHLNGDPYIEPYYYFKGKAFGKKGTLPSMVSGANYRIKHIPIQKGRWYEIQQQIKMNSVSSGKSVGNNDGRIRMWLDGELTYDIANLRLRDNIKEFGVTTLIMSTFMGGGSSFKHTKEERIYFKDFEVFSVE